MANPYSVNINGIISDGVNIYVELSICSGPNTTPSFNAVFPVGTAAATIVAYAQAVADAQPVLDSTIAGLVGTRLLGA